MQSHKRPSPRLADPIQNSGSDHIVASPGGSESPLSDYPDNLSECSEARAEKRPKWHHASKIPPPVSVASTSGETRGARRQVSKPTNSAAIRRSGRLRRALQTNQPESLIDHLRRRAPAVVEQPQPLTPRLSPDATAPTTLEFDRPASVAGSDPGDASEPDLCVQLPPTPSEELHLATLHALSQQLVAGCNVGTSKPEPTCQPEVWADGRQELCETLHYFRAYHGGCYSTGGLVRGFMFDKAAHPRDYMDDTVVISRAGGGLTRDKESGEMKLGVDQSEDSRIASLKNNMLSFIPVVIIAGADNPYIPSKPPHTYCVLDYFKPTHIWFEKSGGKKILRLRFEKLSVGKSSWWQAKNTPKSVELGPLPETVSQVCSVCGESSQQIYLQGWMCLQPSCSSFWQLRSTHPDVGLQEPDEGSLSYDPRWLKQKTSWPNDDHEYSLLSNDAELSGHGIVGGDCSLAQWLGSVCPQCGRCNMRLNWMGWECQNPVCDFKKYPQHTVIPASYLRDPFHPLGAGYALSRDTHAPLLGLTVSFRDQYRIDRYTVPGIDGYIAHWAANRVVVEEPEGPNEMFEELQKVDIGLRRRGLGKGMVKGESYTRSFLVNYGMPYKFIAATASAPFSGAAKSINNTRSRLNWAAKSMLAEDQGRPIEEIAQEWEQNEFNEVLALGYFEQQKINYHDDGEFGLGPTIATLSLGATGTMRIRMKARHYNGVSAAGVYDDSPPLPGCRAYDSRLALQDDLESMKAEDPKAYRTHLKQIPKDLQLKSGGKSPDVLTMTLGHGDIVVMHGAALQKYYEHSVDHAGKLRFALTCRHIDPDSLKPEDRPSYEVAPDEGHYDGSTL